MFAELLNHFIVGVIAFKILFRYTGEWVNGKINGKGDTSYFL